MKKVLGLAAVLAVAVGVLVTRRSREHDEVDISMYRPWPPR
ncbi:hypothetical protein [Kineosporia succinea]|uniref:Energy-converting hydrogenase Eha subunit G n=1 Tax=Kineosporia succinea TaxID=84632 RepID=A0ABT9PCV4_9ACTN|nr:hypothetical protein [Kineosporia succinea]MDP9830542.1 energy-converting hydrogenase Eha subunit G [Kineosporia succinea]